RPASSRRRSVRIITGSTSPSTTTAAGPTCRASTSRSAASRRRSTTTTRTPCGGARPPSPNPRPPPPTRKTEKTTPEPHHPPPALSPLSLHDALPISTGFLEEAFRTDYYRLDITFNDDGSWTYLSRVDLAIRGQSPAFNHHDTNTLRRVAPPIPNPLLAATKK